MPTCGRIVKIQRSQRAIRWQLAAAVRPPSLRDRMLAELGRALPDGVQTGKGQQASELVLSSNLQEHEPLTRQLLALLERSVSINDDADCSHALGVHTLFDPDNDNGTKTYIGEVVSDAKYSRNPWAEEDLSKLMTDFVSSHPLFRQATHITCPPSSSGGVNHDGLANSLARRISAHFGLSFVTIHGPSRTPRKNMRNSGDCSEVDGAFSVTHDLREATTLVVDDLYGHGCTINEVTRALRAAGCEHIFALAGSKDASACNGLPPHTDKWPDWHPPELDSPTN